MKPAAGSDPSSSRPRRVLSKLDRETPLEADGPAGDRVAVSEKDDQAEAEERHQQEDRQHELEEGVEGLVHVSEISKEKITTPVGMYNVGDNLQVKVINVSSKDRKIGLSIKALDEDSSEGSLQDYKKKQAAGPSTIGDLLKTQMESKEEAAAPAEEAAEPAAAEEAPEEAVEADAADAALLAAAVALEAAAV